MPDLRGRAPIRRESGYNQGLIGAATTTLTAASLSTDSHPVIAVVEDGDRSSPLNNFPAGTKLLDNE